MKKRSGIGGISDAASLFWMQVIIWTGALSG